MLLVKVSQSPSITIVKAKMQTGVHSMMGIEQIKSLIDGDKQMSVDIIWAAVHPTFLVAMVATWHKSQVFSDVKPSKLY